MNKHRHYSRHVHALIWYHTVAYICETYYFNNVMKMVGDDLDGKWAQSIFRDHFHFIDSSNCHCANVNCKSSFNFMCPLTTYISSYTRQYATCNKFPFNSKFNRTIQGNVNMWQNMWNENRNKNGYEFLHFLAIVIKIRWHGNTWKCFFSIDAIRLSFFFISSSMNESRTDTIPYHTKYHVDEIVRQNTGPDRLLVLFALFSLQMCN